MEKKLTYKDFKIGQKVVCCASEDVDKEQLYDWYLTAGKTYIIDDLDWHFHDKICVKKDENTGSGFFPITYFVDEAEQIRIFRERKIERILNEKIKKI